MQPRDRKLPVSSSESQSHSLKSHQQDATASVAATERVLRVLETIGSASGEMSATEAAERLDLPVPTVYRLLRTLARSGFVERSERSKGYRLGVKLFELAGAAVAGYDIRDIARPTMEYLVARTQESVQLVVLDGATGLCIDKIDGPQYLRISSSLGGRPPLHCTSTGKVLLAFQSDEFVDRFLEKPLVGYTDNTITDAGRLRSELQAVRDHGIAFSMGGWRREAGGIAAPLYRRGGEIAAAVGIAGPLDRIQAQATEIAELLHEASHVISARLQLGGS